jgi:hypothetical protein
MFPPGDSGEIDSTIKLSNIFSGAVNATCDAFGLHYRHNALQAWISINR